MVVEMTCEWGWIRESRPKPFARVVPRLIFHWVHYSPRSESRQRPSVDVWYERIHYEL